ncbi:LPXTG cell wall anchor domain-containing protein [Streptococcus anginosus]|uniref:LPXTG cell wall anchor domain-containing protein n=2 Tax=Streptococcus anginosus TaxID=1328 RepID=A0A6G4MWJ1_STRAP|nr:LPXTG cell wall anchor domain-containing protein [Streptococcus anginosus]KAA9293983.1 LPXTG cell wall anchor domain-containing protein [Streptococcus anginosus]MCW0987491.1 LPXTG cell wall anchor domain-containing protein [Streptococcus anginosus]MCW1087448.1 LPXTG cell wall anchor domain-containing protein [Streptococcus anginosus]MCW1091565.1 LPXTG cell wall anchor domain-containing protein [Streptococcus anginosus]MDB8651657.1 LPXTG cell wall anchor domain-containing protein [Streptococ
MTKKQFLAALAVSTLVLANGGAVLAEVTPPVVDSSTPGVVAPAPSTPTPSEPNQPAPETPVDPTTPSTNPSETKPENPGTTPAEPSVPSDPTTPSTNPSTEPKQPTPGTTPAEPSEDDKKKEPQPTPKPTEEQPKTTDEANQAGKSQVGTTSTSTGQVVQDVAPNKPVYTENGYTIVGVQDSHPVIANGDGTTSVVEPEVVGATVNADKTVTVSTATGEKKTLPHTGEKEATLLVAMGMTLLAAVYVMKRLARKFHSK